MRTRSLIKRIVIILGAFSILIPLAGCWSTIELNDRAFARLLIFDKGKQGIELTVGFPLPNRMIPGMTSGGQQKGAPYTFVSKEGIDVEQALRNIQIDLSRKITLGQTSVVIIGKELAQEGIGQVLQFLAREPRIHINASMFVTEGQGKELSRIPVVFERFPIDILTAYVRQHETINTTVKDFLMADVTGGGDMVLPLLSFTPKAIQSEPGKIQDWMGVGGAAIFRQTKLAATVGVKGMRGALWVLGQLENAEMTVASPSNEGTVSFYVEHSFTKIKPYLQNDQVHIGIECSGVARILASDTDLNVEDPSQLKILEGLLEAAVQKRIMDMINKTIEMKADAFQFGQHVSWRYPKHWQAMKSRWIELYGDKQVPVNVNADIHIKYLGTQQQTNWIGGN
ncbi:Ger(x)C family spore germination protein [Paenibacillus sp. H1-7]|uniref:Ger(x)C family spore germination protein n=1 Tax=Paenibacillus sp. H1-7 TaxID=2282849 RepID=UPI001EF8CB7C|nr:Ger(x)C family spore germination protein [Paenibacillus sp. H1-7]ULL19000.1 Ger(x)C family spore germination protein [Paenibacillus sp. H1-7]